MKTKFVATVAAALVAGAAGLTLATGASAAVPKLNLSGLCVKVAGGIISQPGYSKFSGWHTATCMVHTVGTNSTQRAVRAVGAAHFNQYKGLKDTIANRIKCAKSVVILRFYRIQNGGAQLLQTVKIHAVPKVQFGKIVSCKAEAGTKYAVGSTLYRTTVFAIDGDGKATGNVIASLVRSAPPETGPKA